MAGDRLKDKLTDRVSAAVDGAVTYLEQRQRPDGGWTDVFSASPMTTALAALAIAMAGGAGLRDQVRPSVLWLNGRQHSDGGWSISDVHPPSNPATTAIVAAVLKYLDPDGSADAVAHAMRYVHANGGERVLAGRVGLGSRSWPAAVPITWAVAGLRDPDDQPYQPVEVMLLPAPVRDTIGIGLPVVLPLGLMQARTMKSGRIRRAVHGIAEPRALGWLRSVLDPNGGVGECPMISALMAIGLHVAGVGQDVARRSLDYLLASRRPDGSWSLIRDIEVTSTAYAVLALTEVPGLADAERLAASREWLLSAQCGQFEPLRIPAGGWGYRISCRWPDCEDTAMVISALNRLGLTRADPAVDTGTRWLRSRQNWSGSWALWIRNSPIVTDRPCPGVTSHALIALRDNQADQADTRAMRRGLAYLRRAQRPNGSFRSSWFRTSTFGTAKVLEAAAALGLADSPVAVRAKHWLLANQHDDGSWSGDLGVGPPGSTPEETAWALYALLNAGFSPWDGRVTRAVSWLVDHQTSAATWTPGPIGLFYDDLTYANDLMGHTFPLRALAKWRNRAGEVR